MAIHAVVHNPVAVSPFLPRTVSQNRADAGQGTISQETTSQQDSYGLSGNGAPGTGDNADRASTASSARPANVYPVPDSAANANPLTEQAPNAQDLVGVPTYNLRGQINAIHPGSGHSLRLSA